VQEIRSYEEPTRIANAPSFIKGVVNLRGVIVPVVDLRIKLGCDKVEYNGFTVVIVLNVHGRVVGAVVDSVSDVLELAGDLIKPAPEMNTTVDTSFITGIASVGERMLILMDIEALMSSADMGLMDSRRTCSKPEPLCPDKKSHERTPTHTVRWRVAVPAVGGHAGSVLVLISVHHGRGGRRPFARPHRGLGG
jgi:purine-binding chemotaxis protein CheW